jgi:hypothetical protein
MKKFIKFFKIIFVSAFLFIGGCNSRDDEFVYMTDIQNQKILMFNSIPIDYRYLPKIKGGVCNIEKIESLESGDIIIKGWIIPSASAKNLANTLLLGLDVEGKQTFGIPRRTFRSDVAEYFHNADLLKSGFEARFKKRTLPEGSCLSMYQIVDHVLIQCSKKLLVNFKVEQTCS